MLLIDCPHCGARPESEFAYAGDATRPRPCPDAPLDVWTDYVYVRADPRGVHREYWHHRLGCGSLLIVTRDTFTHEVVACRLSSTEPLP